MLNLEVIFTGTNGIKIHYSVSFIREVAVCGLHTVLKHATIDIRLLFKRAGCDRSLLYLDADEAWDQEPSLMLPKQPTAFALQPPYLCT